MESSLRPLPGSLKRLLPEPGEVEEEASTPFLQGHRSHPEASTHRTPSNLGTSQRPHLNTVTVGLGLQRTGLGGCISVHSSHKPKNSFQILTWLGQRLLGALLLP